MNSFGGRCQWATGGGGPGAAGIYVVFCAKRSGAPWGTRRLLDARFHGNLRGSQAGCIVARAARAASSVVGHVAEMLVEVRPGAKTPG